MPRIRRAFSLVEVMAVVAILGLILAITVVSLSGTTATEESLTSRNHLRQIAQWLDQYAGTHANVVAPTRFNYVDEGGVGSGHVGGARFYRASSNNDQVWIPTGNPFNVTDDPHRDGAAQGSWADILWVDAGLASKQDMEDRAVQGAMGTGGGGSGLPIGSCSFASPGFWAWGDGQRQTPHPLRSTALNTYHFPRFNSDGESTHPVWNQRGIGAGAFDPEGRPQGLATPVGAGAWEADLPGFFAGNAFFDARSRRDITGDSNDSGVDRFVAHSQVRAPSQALYLVDSFRGETIGESPLADRADYESRTDAAYSTIDPAAAFGTTGTQEVDFRYGGGQATLILFLDGHVASESPWLNMNGLTGDFQTVGRGVRVLDLDRRRRIVNP